ncbi:hypothetical protein Agub_g7352, partial [Astrephomene gubernaculifera]
PPDPAVAAAKQSAAGGFVVPNNAASEAIIRQLREHHGKMTSDLQRRVQSSEARATMAEEQLAALQSYMAKASVSYQKEIVRLRAVIGQMEVSMGVKQGSYLNLNPLEGSSAGGFGGPGGAAALRPAAEVLEEMKERGA